MNKRKSPASTKFFLVLVLLLAMVFAAVWFVTNRYVVIGTHFYPKGQTVLDVQNDNLSLGEYETLARAVPTTRILWNVPFSGVRVTSEATVLNASIMTREDLDALAMFPDLQTLNAGTCTDYALLSQAARLYPQVQVVYSVPVNGQQISGDSERITLTGLTDEDAAMLAYLPGLKTIDATACRDFDRLDALQAAHPEWKILMFDTIAGQKLDPAATSFEVTGASYSELSVGLARMKALKKLTLHDPACTADELAQLKQEYPQVEIRWDVTLFDRVWSDETTEIDLSDHPLTGLDEVRRAADLLPNLKTLIIEKGTVTDEEMAAWRDEARDRYYVIWTVVFSANLKARTDQDWFMPTKVGEYYFKDEMAEKLIYMENVVSMDLGHHPIHNTDFLRYMPKLQYLDLTDTQIKVITNIEYCKELRWLEIDWCYVKDLGNIQECTKLEDLSICSGYMDVEQIAQLTWLKNLRWRGRSYYAIRDIVDALPNTVIYLDGYNPDHLRWRELPNYYEHRRIMGMDPMPEY